MVTASTTASGAMYVNRNPTFKTGMNWVSAMMRKNRLKKNLNWLMSTIGTKVIT